jgi:hypothetical protein
MLPKIRHVDRIQTRIDPKLYEDVSHLAKEHGWSISDAFDVVLDLGLEEFERKDKPSAKGRERKHVRLHPELETKLRYLAKETPWPISFCLDQALSLGLETLREGQADVH